MQQFLQDPVIWKSFATILGILAIYGLLRGHHYYVRTGDESRGWARSVPTRVESDAYDAGASRQYLLSVICLFGIGLIGIGLTCMWIFA